MNILININLNMISSFQLFPGQDNCLGARHHSFLNFWLCTATDSNHLLVQKILCHNLYEARKKMMRAFWTCFHTTSAAKWAKHWLKWSGPPFLTISYSCSLLLDLFHCFHQLFLLLTLLRWEPIQPDEIV